MYSHQAEAYCLGCMDQVLAFSFLRYQGHVFFERIELLQMPLVHSTRLMFYTFIKHLRRQDDIYILKSFEHISSLFLNICHDTQ